MEEVEIGAEKFAKLTIYRGEPEEYVTFITPECYRYWQEYKRWRESIGEKVTPSSYVFVTHGNATSFNPNAVRPASVKTLKNLLGRLLVNLGLRSAISERGGYRNYEFKQAHGFRKFFKTRMEVAGAKPLAIETMMGHNTGVSKSYYKPTTEELAKEYSKAVPELTIVKGGGAMDRDAVLAAIRREMLRGRYTEEVRGFGDLSRLTVEQFVEMLDKKALGLNGMGSQKVVPASEVRAMVEQGWEYVSQLPDGYTIVRLPRPSGGA